MSSIVRVLRRKRRQPEVSTPGGITPVRWFVDNITVTPAGGPTQFILIFPLAGLVTNEAAWAGVRLWCQSVSTTISGHAPNSVLIEDDGALGMKVTIDFSVEMDVNKSWAFLIPDEFQGLRSQFGESPTAGQHAGFDGGYWCAMANIQS